MSLRNILIGLLIGLSLLLALLAGAWGAIEWLGVDRAKGLGTVLFFIFLLLAGWWSVQHEKQRALLHMAGRPSLTHEAFGRQFFAPSQASVATQVREIFAQHFELDTAQVYPDDWFVDELRMEVLDETAPLEFLLDVEKHFALKIPDTAAAEMRTLRDVTEFVVQALEQKGCPY